MSDLMLGFEQNLSKFRAQQQEVATSSTYDFINQESQSLFQQPKEAENQLEQRDMRNLVDKISKVTQLISQVESQVYQQGSIMDRIDLKLQESLTGIEMGNQKLQEAKTSLESGLAARLIKLLLLFNIALFLLSLLRVL